MKYASRHAGWLIPVAIFVLTLACAGASTAFALQIAAGVDHTMVLHSDGTLWGSGLNQFGQLGDGSFTDQANPVQITGNNWVAVSAGAAHTLALKADGTLWSWGRNDKGQLGVTATGAPLPDQGAPVQVGTARDWVAVYAGHGSSSYALKGDGTLWGWGDNSSGQLGNGDPAQSPASQPVPVQVLNPGSGRFTALAAGDGHVLALQSDGSLWSWGSNASGQLGQGGADNLSHAVPVQLLVPGALSDNDWKGVASGDVHSLALKSDGTLWAFGDNSSGQLGLGAADGVAHPVPQQVGRDRDWSGMAAGSLHTLALKRNGSVWGWGDNRSGQVGTGGTVTAPAPVAIEPLVDTVAVAAAGFYSLAGRADGEIDAWGDNGSGEFGNGTAYGSLSPVGVASDGIGWVASEPGNQFTVARRSNGTLWGWGDNSSGQLGDNTLVTRTAPAQIGSATTWRTQAAGLSHTVALRGDGTLWSWGDNSAGQLGDGTSTGRLFPVQVATTSPVSNSNDWAAVAAGDFHTLALKADGTLWSWGDNSFGQLGDGSAPVGHSVPTRVVTGIAGGFDSNWVAVSAGGGHSLGLQADGTLWAWGDNGSGQLGDPSFGATSSTPSQVVNFSPPSVGYNSNWVAISAGLSHSLALQGDGTLWAFGSNFSGQLGNGDAAPRPANQAAPVQVINSGAPFSAMAAADSHSLARRADGTLWLFGNNTSGQLGIGSADPDPLNPVAHATPLQEGSAATDWSIPAAGGGHSVALRSSGTLWAWGSNQGGQLGDGGFNDRLLPAPLAEGILSAAQSVSFGPVPIGTAPAKVLTLANSGGGSLTVRALTLAGASVAQFSVVPGSCGTLPFIVIPGGNCQVQVAFAPALPEGLRPATLTIDSDDPVEPSRVVALSGSAVIPFTISTSVTPAGTGTFNPAGPVLVLPGSSTALTVVPSNGYHVAGVTVDGVPKGALSLVTVAGISGNVALAATFAPNTFAVALNAGANGSIVGPASADFGATPSYSIVPATGYHVVDVTVGGVSKGAVTALNLPAVSGNVAIGATFAVNSYTVTLSPGANGSISGPLAVTYGTTPSYSVIPNVGAFVTDVTVDGVSLGAVGKLTLPPVTGNVTISVTFGTGSFTVTCSGDARGAVSPSGTISVPAGTGQTFAFTPKAGYEVVDVMVDGVSQGAIPSYTFSNVLSGSHTVSVLFTPDGDMNGDGKVTVTDAILALRIAVGLQSATASQLRHGDVAPGDAAGIPVPDHKLAVGDALVILKKTVGLTSGF